MDKLEALRQPNPRVRRRLFDEDHNNQDLDNILQEFTTRDRNNMKQRWNFDFDKEEPLEGKYQWYKLDRETWVSVEPKPTEFKPLTEFDLDTLEKENQATPRIHRVDIPPVIRKRKRDEDMEVSDKGAKRKIKFD